MEEFIKSSELSRQSSSQDNAGMTYFLTVTPLLNDGGINRG